MLCMRSTPVRLTKRNGLPTKPLKRSLNTNKCSPSSSQNTRLGVKRDLPTLQLRFVPLIADKDWRGGEGPLAAHFGRRDRGGKYAVIFEPIIQHAAAGPLGRVFAVEPVI